MKGGHRRNTEHGACQLWSRVMQWEIVNPAQLRVARLRVAMMSVAFCRAGSGEFPYPCTASTPLERGTHLGRKELWFAGWYQCSATFVTRKGSTNASSLTASFVSGVRSCWF